MSLSSERNPHPLLVAPLDHFRRTDLALAGGKGANLGELIASGFAVPPGYVITTAAYDLQIQGNNLQTYWQETLAAFKVGDSKSIAQACQHLQDAFQQAPMTDQIAAEVLQAYRQLGHKSVAVRSSATAEDLPEAAFAGQQETLLNIVGEEELLEAVRTCWASLWSERAVLYRAHQQIEQTAVKLAVVVQQMVPAEVAGVMFTANPITGEREELVIDANPGLGEAVVSGLVIPDHFVVDKRSRRVKEQQIGRRELIIQADARGGTERIVPPGAESLPALPTPAIRQLAQLGLQIEKHYGSPQDVEWAWVADTTKAGKFWILQARPMTALPEPLQVSPSMRRILPILAEMFPTRPYPLDVTTFSGTLEKAVGKLLVSIIGKSAPDPDKLLLEEDGVVVRFQPPDFHPSPGMLITPWLALWRTRHNDPSQWEADPLLAEVLAGAQALEQRNLPSLTWQQNLETLHEALVLIPQVMKLRERYIPQTFWGLGTLWLLLALARQRDRLGVLLSGVETKTTETNRALEALAGQVRRDGNLRDLFACQEARDILPALAQSPAGQEFRQNFYAFLAQYGHRETSLTISQGAWQDQPEAVLGILKVLAATEPTETERDKVWHQAREELQAHSLLGTRPLRHRFQKALINARSLFQIREDTHFYATLAQPPIRRVALELGGRLAQAGALESVSDVFHLRLEELESLAGPWPPAGETLAQIRALAARRKAKRQSLANQPLVDPRLLTVARQRAGEEVLLSGSPGSPGLASGRARIVLDFSEFCKLQPGDVLVAPVTNPAWTPLFQRVAAVVVDTGGTASHAAIVAREYGIPAVMGTVTGTRQLADGQWIQVDGSRGYVLKAEEPL